MRSYSPGGRRVGKERFWELCSPFSFKPPFHQHLREIVLRRAGEPSPPSRRSAHACARVRAHRLLRQSTPRLTLPARPVAGFDVMHAHR